MNKSHFLTAAALTVPGFAAFASPPVPSTVPELAASIERTIAEFQAANDERIAGIERGFDDVVKREEVDRINGSITDLKTALDEQLQALALAGQTREEIDARAQLRADAQIFYAGVQGIEENTRLTDADYENYENYVNLFSKFIRRGPQAMAMDEIRASMEVGSDPDGGFWVPTQVMSTVIKRLFDTSPMRQLASVMTITTDSVTWPNDLNDITTGGFVGEHDARSETATVQVGDQTIYVREQYAMPIVTQKLLDMASIDIEGWLNGKIVDKYSRVENTKYVNGNGVLEPRGFMDYASASVTTGDTSRSWGVLQHVLSGAAGGFPTNSGATGSDVDTIIALIASLHPSYRSNAKFAMNRATEELLRKLKDNDGRYLLGGFDTAINGFRLHGFPIVNLEDMSDPASDSFSIAFGDWAQGYQILDGRGMRMIRDNVTTKGKVKFYTTKWTGGDVVNFDAIKLMKMAA